MELFYESPTTLTNHILSVWLNLLPSFITIILCTQTTTHTLLDDKSRCTYVCVHTQLKSSVLSKF